MVNMGFSLLAARRVLFVVLDSHGYQQQVNQ